MRLGSVCLSPERAGEGEQGADHHEGGRGEEGDAPVDDEVQALLGIQIVTRP